MNKTLISLLSLAALQDSELLAASIHAAMRTHPQYPKELAAARLELRQSPGLATAAQ